MNSIETEMTTLEAKIKDVEDQDSHCAPLILLLIISFKPCITNMLCSKDITSSDGPSKLDLCGYTMVIITRVSSIIQLHSEPS